MAFRLELEGFFLGLRLSILELVVVFFICERLFWLWREECFGLRELFVYLFLGYVEVCFDGLSLFLGIV